MKFLQPLKNLYYSLKKQVSGVRSVFSWAGGQAVNPETALKVAAYYRGLMYLSTQVANMSVYVKDSKNNILPNDKVSVLLNLAPNKEMSAHTFKLMMLHQAISYGNFVAEIRRNMMGMPVELVPIGQYEIYPWRDAQGDLWYRVVGGSTETPGADAYLRPMDVFHIKNINTIDGLVGQGLVHYAVRSLGISLGADTMAESLFQNMGMPSGVISVKGKLSPEAGGRLKDNWKDAHSNDEGKKKAGGTAVLEEGATFTPINLAPNVLQFLESRKFGVVEIARFLGVHPSKLYDTESATTKDYEQISLDVASDTLNTWTKVIEAEANIKLLNYSYGGKKTEFDLYEVTRGDMKTRGTYYKDMMQTGAITPNEIRMKEGFAGYKDGDKFFIATNNYTPANMVDKVVEATIARGNNAGNNGNSDTEDEVKKAEAELAKAEAEYLRSRT